jgi:hypothetical protein
MLPCTLLALEFQVLFGRIANLHVARLPLRASSSLASRSAPVPPSPLAPYPCEARVRSDRRARHEKGARSERGTGTEREWEAPARGAWRRPRGATQEGASGRHQLPTGAWRRLRGATQEGASTGGRDHRRRKLRGVRVSELPKEPANNP